MLMPKKQKYRKQMRRTLRGVASSGYTLDFGDYGLKALEQGFLSSRQIEAARRTIAGTTKRQGKVWIRLFPDKPISKKPLAVRMGSGKGPTDHYAARVLPGKILFEMSGVPEEVAKESLRKASHKMPFRTKFIVKKD